MIVMIARALLVEAVTKMQRLTAVILKLIVFLGLLSSGYDLLQALPASSSDSFVFNRINYDSMVEAIVARSQQFENQKYVQGGLVGTSVVALIAAWRLWPQDVDSSDSSGSHVPSQGDAAPKKEKSVFLQLWNHGTKNFGMVFVSIFAAALAQQLGTDVFGGGKKILKKIWSGSNNCCFYESLAMVALNSYDGFLLRRKEGITSKNLDVMVRYNLCIRAFERYVVEIAASTAHLTRKHGLSSEALDTLLVQFVGDVDDANYKIINLDAPLSAKDARGKKVFGSVMETLGHIKELHARLMLGFDQEKVGHNNVTSDF